MFNGYILLVSTSSSMELEKFYLNQSVKQPEKHNHVLLNNLKNILLFIINLFLLLVSGLSTLIKKCSTCTFILLHLWVLEMRMVEMQNQISLDFYFNMKDYEISVHVC